MIIVKKSVHIIDYESQNVYHRNIPNNFDNYITELVDYIEHNTNTRAYRSKSDTTQVLVDARRIFNTNDTEQINNSFENIAKRLLDAEIKVQATIGRMNINVKKGSLIQALMHDPYNAKYSFLLAKVEHGDFVDDNDFSFKTGFSKDKKNIWKTCIIDLSNPIGDIYYSRIYSDTAAKYWSDSFLEFEELNSDENNTFKSFTETEKIIKRKIKNISPRDYEQIRNNLIGYYRTHDYISYQDMISELVESYVPYDETVFSHSISQNLMEILTNLPEQKGFDSQFSSMPSEIKARMKRRFTACDGVEINVLHEIAPKTIRCTETISGERLLLVKTDNTEIFNTYYDNSINISVDGE